jgi:hypothetical protein
LLVERQGGLWGIANGAVLGVAGAAPGYRIRLGRTQGGETPEDLAADAVLGVVEDLRVSPAGPSIARFWPQPVLGLAVHGGRPLVVIDPGRPPRVLVWERSLESEVERGERSDVDTRADAS